MIRLDGHSLTTQKTWSVAVQKERAGLAPRAVSAMRASRELVDRLAAEPRAIYGINTGYGPLSGERVGAADMELHQLNLLRHLGVGQGPLFSPRETRAIMLARANTLARGFSGIRPGVVDALLRMLNADALPEIPSLGSVGASGDLAPLAHMAGALVGMGRVNLKGKSIPAAAALKALGMKPLRLKCKEGLALVNGTSVMTGLAALACREAADILSWCELMSACLMQALFAEPEVLCEQLHKARGHRGQFISASRIAAALKTNHEYARMIRRHQWGTHAKSPAAGMEIQDAYSLRCAPQILGAFQDALWHVESVIERELNASTDNPLVFPATGTIIHGGNFYGQQVSMACDYLRIGLVKIALLVERQIDRLVNWRYSNGLPPLLTGAEPGLNSGMAGCQLLATALAAEARILGTPASYQSIPTNANNQDVVSMGCTAARFTCAVLPLLWRLLGVEAMALAQAADLRRRAGRNVMGKAYAELHEIVRASSAELFADRALSEEIAAVTDSIRRGENLPRCVRPRQANPIRLILS